MKTLIRFVMARRFNLVLVQILITFAVKKEHKNEQGIQFYSDSSRR